MKKLTLLILLAFMNTVSVYGVKSDEEMKRREIINNIHILRYKELSFIKSKFNALSSIVKECKSDEYRNTCIKNSKQPQ